MRVLLPIVVIVVALAAATGVYVVGEGHAAVLTRLGAVRSADVPPGLHFKLPLVDRVTVYDTRVIVQQSEPEDYQTSDGDPVRAGFFVRWQVSDPAAYFRATGGDELQVTRQMAPVIHAALRAQIGQHDLAGLLAADGGPIDQALAAAVGAGLRAKLGVSILAIGVGRVLPPDDALPTVYKRMTAEADASAGTVRDAGDAAAASIRAKGATADRVVLAAAASEAAAVRGEGDAQAAKIATAAATEDPQFFRYWSAIESWRRTFAAGDAIVVLDRGSPLLQAIDAGAPGGEAPTPKKR